MRVALGSHERIFLSTDTHVIKISDRLSILFSLLKILLTGVQFFIARGVRHRVVAGTVFSGDCLKRLW